MVNLDVAELRSEIDVEKKYVDFSLVRASLTVTTLVADLNISLSEPNEEGECRGKCPKCEKERSFVLNVSTNRFNCFAKGCNLKGGGVIDFFAKLYGVTAKEVSHLLAYIYGIQPYTQEDASVPPATVLQPAIVATTAPNTELKREVASPREKAAESLPTTSDDTRQSAQYLIASIEHQLAELKQLLTIR